MKKPDTPVDETLRISNLHSLNILDTDSEERFDRITRLAKHMFNVPIALISLIDSNRQWFKACEGLNVRETPRDISFCGHSILENEIFIIPDASKDERFADNPLVVNEPNIRFYCGCPLKHTDNTKLGTLCIIDTEPREMSVEQLRALKDLATLAERELTAIQIATLDDLTRISNRKGFMLLAQQSLNMNARSNSSACLVFLDLNKFKEINDEFGHAEGDRALVAFADLLRCAFRDSDVIGRLGGDEFVALLNNAALGDAQQKIDQFREVVDIYNQEANYSYDLSFSEGIALIDASEKKSLESILDEADKLMYLKKKKSYEY